MLSSQHEQVLRRALANNKCVLFLGAGFSTAATNRLKHGLPTGWQLASALWELLGYVDTHGEYDGTPLDRLFDIARRVKGERALNEFLDDRLRVTSYPDFYRVITYPFWHRIYTTNVDDLVERCFADARSTKLEVINAARARYKERDQFLERLQYIKLNGSIEDGLDHVTFGARQYAKRSSEHDIWYDQFVRDYSSHVTIIIGSQVNEPMFSRAIEERQGRHGAALELRLRSFLVADRISPAVAHSLSDFAIEPVTATAEQFLAFLDTLLAPVPSREEMLVRVDPRRAEYLQLAGKSPEASDAIKAFYEAFTKIEPLDAPRSHRSLFLHGATPDWDDIALGLDAKRQVTGEAQDAFQEALADTASPSVFVVSGHRGAGKSTLMMRTATNLSAAGHAVFFAVGEDVHEPHHIARAVDRFDRRVALFIDDAEWVIGRAEELVAALASVRTPPLLVLAVRSNSQYTVADIDCTEVVLGDLTESDIEAVIDVLEKNNSLGVVTGQSRATIRDLFQQRARKQLLVAMKEVTTGRQFDDIIRSEYNDIADQELRTIYLVACLATAAGTSLTRTQLLAASTHPRAVLLSGLARELKGVLVHAEEYGDRVVARHSVIAQTVIEETAPKAQLVEAYKRILSVLANDMSDRGSGDGRRWFRLYKRLINHAELLRRLEGSIEDARAVFDSVHDKVTSDGHFWLQYGSLELERGDLDLASRYISTAEALRPTDFLVRNAKGHLLLSLARSASTLREAASLRSEAVALLEELIDARGDDSDYPWHILVSHSLQYCDTWVRDEAERRIELHTLLQRANEACEARPRSRALQELRAKVERSYMMLSVNK